MMDWLAHLPRHQLDPALIGWITQSHSLTRKLREHYPRLRVRLLRQTLARPHRDERRLLGLRTDQLAWVREVLLCDGATPLVFAHSVLPLAHVRGAWNLFSGLGARPLGEVLFTDPGIARRLMQYRKLDARHPLYPKDAGTLTVWARRSLYTRNQRALLVSEVFLPALTRLA